MDVDAKLELITRNTLEVVTVEELRSLLEKNPRPKAYIGFEPSGFVHTGQAICAAKVVDLQNAGVEVVVFLADWHAMINDKLGGRIEDIRVCGEYLKECFIALGAREDTRFVWANDLVSMPEYWEKFIRVCKASSLQRIKRAMTIMGRTEDEAEIDASKVMYPPMQVADIFQLDVDIAYAGMDQRRAHMLARDAAEKLGWKKPIALHTPLLMSLAGSGRMDPVEAKMSKSDPKSSILLHDSPAEIQAKMKGAFCPVGEVEGNPVLEVVKLIVFPRLGRFDIERPEKYGGKISFTSYDEVQKAFAEKALHPQDLKKGAADAVAQCFAPVREYFQRNPKNLQRVKELTVTR